MFMKTNWRDIESALASLRQTEGGYTRAQRGIITLQNNSRAFVKIGTDHTTKQWVGKEIAAYLFLEEHSYPFIPQLLAINADRSGFVVEALLPEEGWDWTDTWSDDRLNKTFEAMDALAAISMSATEKALFKHGMVNPGMDGWRRLAASPEKQETLLARLRESGYQDIAATMDSSGLAEKSAHFTVQADTLTHNDMRADNCAWNFELSTVKLVDWTWLQLSDRRIDANALLVHVYGCGFNVTQRYRSRLDKGALLWLAGMWLLAAISPLDQNTAEAPALRDYQLASGVSALKLYREITC